MKRGKRATSDQKHHEARSRVDAAGPLLHAADDVANERRAYRQQVVAITCWTAHHPQVMGIACEASSVLAPVPSTPSTSSSPLASAYASRACMRHGSLPSRLS